MQNVNKQLGNGSIIHRCSNIFNRASIPVKMFFNHLTAWLKPHRKKTLDHKKV